MTIGSSVPRKASARLEALESRKLFSGEIDHSFGANGEAYAPDTAFRAVAVQPDGKTVVAGAVDFKSNDAVIERYTTAGLLDKTFGGTGRVVVKNVAASRIDSVTVLSSGKILVGGQNYFRLNGAGTLDKTYGGGDGIAPSKLAGDRRASNPTVVYSDGSVVELGDHADAGKNRVYKYKADGSLDTSFGNKGSFDLAPFNAYRAGAIATDSSKRLYVAYVSDGGDLFIARLTSAGKLDTTWGNKGVAAGAGGIVYDIDAMAVLPDGRVLLGYEVSTSLDYHYSQVFSAKGVAGITGTGVDALNDQVDVQSFVVAKDGSVFVGGRYSVISASNDPSGVLYIPTMAAVAHLNKDLSLDKNYSTNKDGVGGYGIDHRTTRFAGMAVDASGRAIVLGETSRPQDNTFVRLTAPGTANRVSYTQSAKSFVFTGSSGVDSVTMYDAYDESAGVSNRAIRLDDQDTIQSADVVIDLTIEGTYTFNLGGGDDRFDGRDSSDTVTINAGAGNDFIYGGFKSGFVINGGDGDDTIDDIGTEAVIHGDKGNDSILVGNYGKAYGDAGLDKLYSATGYASLYGGDGDDNLYHANGLYPSTLDGGAGKDTAIYTAGDILKDIENSTVV